MQKTSYRKVCLLGAVLSSIGLSALPFTPNIPYMIAFYGIITGSCDNLLIHQFKFTIKYSILFYLFFFGGGAIFSFDFYFCFHIYSKTILECNFTFVFILTHIDFININSNNIVEVDNICRIHIRVTISTFSEIINSNINSQAKRH